MTLKDLENLYSSEISLISSPEYAEYIQKNLQKIKEKRQSFHLPVIGIAGTNGKTTTKRMLSAILSRRGPVLETPLDCHTSSTVTSTLLKLNSSHKYAVLELGMISQNQFKLAVEVAKPTAGIVTNVGETDLDEPASGHLVANAKVELVRKLPPSGFALLNIDDELVSGMDALCSTQRIIKFGFNARAQFSASKLEYLGPEGMKFCVNNYYQFHLPIYSSTSVSNALAAISAARILGLEFDEIQNGLENDFSMLHGRGNFINLEDVYILDHTYSATINAVSKACESLVQFKKFSKKLILVLGDMERFRGHSAKIHRNLGYYISALPIDVVITVGGDSKFVGDGIRQINHTKKIIEHCAQKQELPARIIHNLEPHTTVLLIGSKDLSLGEELEVLIKKLETFQEN